MHSIKGQVKIESVEYYITNRKINNQKCNGTLDNHSRLASRNGKGNLETNKTPLIVDWSRRE